MHICFHLAERLTGVTVKVSDRTPPVKTPKDLDGSGYSLCAKYSAKPKAGQIINMKCRANAAGRYVYVYIPTTNYLTICEVEVYGDRKYTCGRYDISAILVLCDGNPSATRGLASAKASITEIWYFTVVSLQDIGKIDE